MSMSTVVANSTFHIPLAAMSLARSGTDSMLRKATAARLVFAVTRYQIVPMTAVTTVAPMSVVTIAALHRNVVAAAGPQRTVAGTAVAVVRIVAECRPTDCSSLADTVATVATMADRWRRSTESRRRAAFDARRRCSLEMSAYRRYRPPVCWCDRASHIVAPSSYCRHRRRPS